MIDDRCFLTRNTSMGGRPKPAPRRREDAVRTPEVFQMLRKRQLIFVLVTLLVISAIALAQQTGGAVNGRVVDQNNAAILNATVTLKNEATGQTLTTQSTSNGDFNFPNTLGGDYTITVEAGGFQANTQKVKVLLNQESTINLVLI